MFWFVKASAIAISTTGTYCRHLCVPNSVLLDEVRLTIKTCLQLTAFLYKGLAAATP